MPELLIGVDWRASDDNISYFVSRALAHFESLASAGHGLDRRFHKASRNPKVPVPVPADVMSMHSLAGLLGKGVNRNDTDGRIITEPGRSNFAINYDIIAIAAFEGRKWPLVLAQNTVRYANGVIKISMPMPSLFSCRSLRENSVPNNESSC